MTVRTLVNCSNRFRFQTGNRVYANPRAIVAMMRQCNTVDMSRRSPSYEVRLAKYSARAFEVYVPSLSRADIDPTVSHPLQNISLGY
jgi:hypothetical protein